MPSLLARVLAPLLTVLAAAAVAVLSLSHPASSAVPAAATARPAVSTTSLDLPAAQLDAIRVERVATHAFPMEKDAVGSISYDENPAIVQAQATFLAAAANLELSSKELKRLSGLGESNGIAQKDLEQALASEQGARAAFKAAHDALRALGASDGEIERLRSRGNIASASRPHRKWALANVAEGDSVLVQPGQPISLMVMALPGRTYSGRVSRVYASVDPTTHRVGVRAEVSDPRDELRSGMLAEFKIRVAAAVAATAIPAKGAVREADGSTSVWVTIDRHHFAQRTVRIGERDAGWVQILDGVRAGELVVTDGAVFLSNLLQAPPSD